MPAFEWTLEKYHDAIEKGVLTELDRVELLLGQIIAKVPVGELHADITSQLVEFFVNRFGLAHKYRIQNPVTLPNNSEPEPDFAVVVHRAYNKQTGHPGPDDILLLIEVSDSTLVFDQTQKARAYALAGISEYWIINLPDHQVELHLNPNPEKGNYRTRSIHEAGTTFASPFCGEVVVNEIIPEETPQ